MGKSGELLRAKKQKETLYTFTKEQLEAHDELVIKTRKERIVQEMYKKAHEMNEEINQSIREEWDNREKLFSDKGLNTNLIQIIALLIGISARILVEEFGWQPLPKDGNYRKSRKLARFCQAVSDKVSEICEDSKTDIRQYNEETYELYGVKFTVEEEE